MNKENKKKFYDILNNNMTTPTPQQRTTARENDNAKQKQKQNNSNNDKSTYEQQQEQRRRLLEEFKRKKETEKQNKQNNKMKGKPTAQKKIEEKHLSRRTTTKIIKAEPKNANAYSSSLNNNNSKSNLDEYQTPVQNPVKYLSPRKSVSSTEKMKSQLDNDTKKYSQRHSLIHSKSPVSGRSQGVLVELTTINDNSPPRISSLSRVEHQRLVSLPKNDLYSTSADSPSKALSPYRRFSHKRSPIQPNPAILSFGKAQRMKKNSIEAIDGINEETQLPALSTPVIYTTPQVSQTPQSTKEELSGNNVQRSKLIPDSEDITSSFEFTSSPAILLPKLKRLTPKRSPMSNLAIASLGKAQRIRVAKIDDGEDNDFLTPKASDYTNNTSVKTNEGNSNKARNFFSVLASTPFKEIINESGRLLEFSQAEGSNTDNSFVEQKVDRCVNTYAGGSSSITDDLEISEIQKADDSFKETSPFLKDVSIQTSPSLLDQLRNQEDLKDKKSPKFDFTKWTRQYVLCVYDPKTYDVKYTEVVPFPTISFYTIKDAVRVAETGSELLARAIFDILEADWPPHSKKVGTLVENIPPREKARYWIERAKFEERCMRYEEALQSYERAEELNAKPIELVKEEHEKFLARLCSYGYFGSFSSEHEDYQKYQSGDDYAFLDIDYDNDGFSEDGANDDNDLLGDLAALLEYESGIDHINNGFSDGDANDNLLGEDLSALLEYESGIDYNGFSEEKSEKSYRDAIIAEPLDNSTIDIKEEKVIKYKNSVKKTPETIDSSLTILTSVKAKKKEREEMGVEKVVTPVRRSARIHTSSHSEDDYQTPEDQKIAILLEENGFAYVPNPALYYNRNLTPLKKSSKKNEQDDNTILEKPKPVSGKKTVTWKDLKN